MSLYHVDLKWIPDEWVFEDGFLVPPTDESLSLELTLRYLIQMPRLDDGEYTITVTLREHIEWYTELYLGDDRVRLSRGFSWRVSITLTRESGNDTVRVESAVLYQTLLDGTERVRYTLCDDDAEYVENVLLDILVPFRPNHVRPGRDNEFTISGSVNKTRTYTFDIMQEIQDETSGDIESSMVDVPNILEPATLVRFLIENTEQTERVLVPLFWINDDGPYKLSDYL